MNDTIIIKDKGLKQLLKAMKGTIPVARVGVLGGNGNRTDAVTNADVGAAHEFGTDKLPVRSFLREPITDNLNKRLQEAGAFDKQNLNEVIRIGSLLPWLQKVAVVANGIVLEAFDTGGFGKWKPSDFSKKKNHQTLVETQQLRNSITWDVK